MIIAIRLQILKINDIEVKSVYIDKTVYSLMAETTDKNGNVIKVRAFSDETLSKPPYNFKKVEIDDNYKDCISTDFNEDLTFNIDKYNARKEQEKQNDYENKIVAEIRKKYNLNQELAILRQRDAKPEEFAEYNEYVESCKTKIKEELNNKQEKII